MQIQKVTSIAYIFVTDPHENQSSMTFNAFILVIHSREGEKNVETLVSLPKLSEKVEENLEELTRSVPDIFEGTREAYQLLKTVSQTYGRYGVEK